jgi:hypothetical protein
MKHIRIIFLFIAAMSLPAVAEDWNNVALVDVMCSAKAKADPDSHPRDCALQCQKSGFGVVTPQGEFLKLDSKGNQEALALLKSTPKNDHLRVSVSGTRKGDQISVAKIHML